MRIFRFLAPVKKQLKKHAIIASFVGGAVLVALIMWIAPMIHLPSLSLPGLQNYSEAQELSSKPMSFQEYSTYFQKLADKKGGAYAFQVLGRTSFPPGVDIHLLGHIVGDVLYKQKGVEGIKICTPDFRNACSHSIVIGVLNEKGESALPEIAQACKEAPGGKGAYTMCFHGLGHGVLAFTGYDLKEAVAMCKLVGTPQYHDQEYVECVGGTIMEIIAGVHDRTAWEKQVGNYFKDSDPLFPCDASWMPDEVRGVCYIQLTPHLFTAAGGDLGNLLPTVYPKAFSYCDALPKDSAALRQACYGGFGKEFTVLAQGRDIRAIGSMPTSALQNVRDWCAMANNKDGELACDSFALSSLFWGGENVADASFQFCALATGDAQVACYQMLSGQIGYYLGNDAKGSELCKRLPEKYRAGCVVPAS